MLKIKLKDGKHIAGSIFEIVSFPSKEHITVDAQKAFSQMVFEFYKISLLHTSAIEFLWVSEAVENQTFQSKVRVFIILRQLGTDEQSIEKQLSIMMRQVTSVLQRLNYDVKPVDDVKCEFLPLVKERDMSTLFSVVKAEQVSNGTFYQWSVLNENSQDNLADLIDILSQERDCCVSFQLIPTALSEVEKTLLFETRRMYEQMLVSNSQYSGNVATDAFRSVQYMMNQENRPLFLSNICVWGSHTSCRLVTTKVLSLLQSGETEIADNQLLTLDLSSEKINIYQHFFMYPWLINEKLIKKYRDRGLLRLPLIQRLSRMPYIMSIAEANIFFRLPLHEKEMKAITMRHDVGDGEEFDASVTGENIIEIGAVTGDGTNVTIGCPINAWTTHAAITGMPGTGKTTFAINLLTQFASKGIPFLVIEPTKTEYRALIDVVDDIQIFTPGNNGVSPFILNPFIPPKGVTMEKYKEFLFNAFKAAFSMDGPLEMLFRRSLNACYLQYGWKMSSTRDDDDVTFFGMHEYILCFKKVMSTMNYQKDVKSNLETAGLLRLLNLIEQNRNIFDTINTITIEELLSKPTVLELNAIENHEQKALLIALITASICAYTKNKHDKEGLNNILLIDEAHVLLDVDSHSDGHRAQNITAKTIEDMIMEIRACGTGIIIADQRPTKITDDIVSNCNVKITFRLSSPKERTLMAENMEMNDSQRAMISRLKTGQAYVHYDPLVYPHCVQTEDARARDGVRLHVPDAEIMDRNQYWKENQHLLIPFRECYRLGLCEHCDLKIRENANYYAEKYLELQRGKKANSVQLGRWISDIIPFLKSQGAESHDFQKLCYCTIISFLRKRQLETSDSLSAKEMRVILNFVNKDLEEGGYLNG